MPDTDQICPQCGARLKPGVPGGLCLRCLLSFGLKPDAAETGGDSAGKPLVPPDGIIAGEFDRFHVLEKIGEGGCGVVYRAEQLQPVQREVALKVIKLGMDTQNVIARFEIERQALARMDHPNIARVFDAGSTRAGRPFFAMELVRGERITDYCDRHCLSIPRRLELFARVCEAVQHAHQKGVIHRDLKPSNILVTDADGSPQPKIIDFGVAKATARQRLADQTIYTTFDQFVGTPAYMSPEQAGLTGEDVDTRSDIYSLGVLLYELLAGRPPFEPEQLRRAALNELCRIICEKEPARPSTQLTTLTEANLTEIARRRSVAPAKLLRELRGDLDWIVMRALEKDRARRYETATGFGLEIQRLLAHEPVMARPPGAAYRTRKFVRRHRLAVAAATIATSAVLCGLALSTWMFFQERAARQRAVLAEHQQEILRNEAEARAYAADMNTAARTATAQGSLGSVANLLRPWRTRKPDLRGWEWYYLNGVCQPEATTLQDETNIPRGVAWSPDGQRLAVVGSSAEVTLWEAVSKRELARLRGHQGSVYAVAWSPDGRQLASSGSDRTIRIWDASNGSEVAAWRGHDTGVNCIAWRANGKQLASAAAPGVVKIWDAPSGAIVSSFQAVAEVFAVAWHPDGTRLASAGEDNVVRIWDANLGRALQVLEHGRMSGYLRALDWSPDGHLLAAGGSDAKVRLWDADEGKIAMTMIAHPGAVLALKWSPDGRQIATTGRDDGVVKIWDSLSGKCVNYFRGHLLGVRSLAWHPDGNRVASASLDGTVKLWNLDRPDSSLQVLSQEEQIMSVAWHPDGQGLATASRDGSIRFWGGPRNEVVHQWGSHDVWAWKVAWHPSGTHLASAGGDGVVKLWSAATGAEVWSAPVFPSAIRALAWSPDGQQLAVTSGRQALAILDSASRTIRSFTHRSSAGLVVAWSPDGRCIATEGDGHDIQLLDAVSGAQLRTMRWHGAHLRCLAWSPDGLRLASSADDGQAIIWDAQTGAELHTLSGHSGAVYAVAWRPDGSRLATGSWDQTVKIWNPKTGQLLCSLDEQFSEITTLDWSPDGNQLACGNLAGKIFIYDSRPGLKDDPR